MRVNKEDLELIRRSNLLNKKWYAKQYRDVELLGMDPIEHYVKYGARLGRDPSASFSASFYKENFLEKSSNVDPLLHYLKVGSKKGYKIKPNALHLRDLLKAGNRGRAKYLSQFCNKTVRETFPIIEMAIETSGKGSRGKEYADALSSSLFSPRDLSGINVSSENDQNDFFLRIESAATSSVSGGELITVIMPAYNSEATVAKSIGSILKQTWKNLQLIVVDDCSGDKTYDVAKKALANDKRAILLKNKKNVGPYVSKNLALKYAKGDYITGQDADDWSHPQRLEKHMELIKKDGNVRASMAYMFRMQMDGTIEIRREGILIGSSISTMFQAEFLKSTLGHWDCAKFGADSELISRAKKFLGDEFKYYKFPSMVCLASPDSLTSNPEYGVSVEHGLSPVRVAYREAWSNWHLKASKSDLYIPFPHVGAGRCFEVPGSASVPEDSILHNIKML